MIGEVGRHTQLPLIGMFVLFTHTSPTSQMQCLDILDEDDKLLVIDEIFRTTKVREQRIQLGSYSGEVLLGLVSVQRVQSSEAC